MSYTQVPTLQPNDNLWIPSRKPSAAHLLGGNYMIETVCVLHLLYQSGQSMASLPRTLRNYTPSDHSHMSNATCKVNFCSM